MTILKSNSGKIYRGASGEVLKVPPLIDISSDYGVTKDGSNLVSQVKNRYAPNVFRAPSGENPIENGDGFEFTRTDRLEKNTIIDYNSDYEISMWLKMRDLTTSTQMIMAHDGRNVGSSLKGYYYYNPSINGFTTNLGTNITNAPILLDTWVFVSFISISTLIYRLFDGVMFSSPSVKPSLAIDASPLGFGASPVVNSGANCNLDDIYIDKPRFNPVGALDGEQVFTPPKRSSE